MAKLPGKQSTARLTSEAPAPRIGEDSLGSQGRSLERIGQTMGVIEDQLRQVRDLRQVTEAEAEASRLISEKELEIEQSGLIDGVEDDAVESFDQIIEEQASRISDFSAQQRFRASMNARASNKLLSIRKSVRMKELDRLEADTNSDLETLKGEYFQSDNPNQRGLFKALMMKKIDDLRAVGAIDAADAQEQMTELSKELRIGEVYQDAEVNSDVVLEELAKGKEGLYADLLPEERKNLTKDVTDIRKKNLEIAKLKKAETVDTSDRDLALRIQSGEVPSVAEIDRLAVLGAQGVQGGISSEMASAARKLATSSQAVDPTDKAEIYDDLINNLSRIAEFNEDGQVNDIKATFAELGRFRAAVIDASAKGVITDSKRDKLLSLVVPKFNEGMESAFKEVNKIKGTGTLFGLFAQRMVPKSEEKDAVMFLTDRYFEFVLAEEDRLKRRLTDEELHMQGVKALNIYRTLKNPSYAAFRDRKPGDVIPTDLGPVVLRGFDQDGEPLIDMLSKK